MATTILWHLANPFTTERCMLTEAVGTRLFEGTVLHLTEDGCPCQTSYSITLDAGWRTQHVHIQSVVPGEAHTLHLTSDGAGAWWQDDMPLPALAGCVDVDLGITPATNTLPIRRLALAVGQSAEVDAAWVRFPALTVERLPQRYTRLAPDQYRYESPNFTARLTVDAHGLVRDYEGLWHAVAIVDDPDAEEER